MKAILWTQGVIALTSSTMVIDGQVHTKEYSSAKEKAYEELVRYSQRPPKLQHWIKLLQRLDIIKTEQFLFTHVKGEGIYFQTVSKTQDERGRRIAMMFYCQTDSIIEACATFRAYARLAERQPVESELHALEQIEKYGKYAVPAIVIVSLCIFVLLAYGK